MDMPVEVTMPQVGESMKEGEITRWLVQVGAVVERDQPLFEISTDKVDAEVPSPHTGVLSRILYPEGSTVPINTVVALIDNRFEVGSGQQGVRSVASGRAALSMNKWTTEDFDQLSWHDNHIHGFSLREGGEAVGDLVLDIDFILEWICDDASGGCDFRIAPATLTFHEVSDLILSLDYVATTAALCPASIGGIEREEHAYPNGYTSFAWAININWPAGAIRFKASGFTQVLRAEPIVVPGRQYLTAEERKSLSA